MRLKTFHWLKAVNTIQEGMQRSLHYSTARKFMFRTRIDKEIAMIVQKGHRDFHEYAEACEGLLDVFKDKIAFFSNKLHVKNWIKNEKKWR